MSKFLAGRVGDSPSFPSVGKNLYIYNIYIYMYICIYRENPVFIGFSLCIYIYIYVIYYV